MQGFSIRNAPHLYQRNPERKSAIFLFELLDNGRRNPTAITQFDPLFTSPPTHADTLSFSISARRCATTIKTPTPLRAAEIHGDISRSNCSAFWSERSISYDTPLNANEIVCLATEPSRSSTNTTTFFCTVFTLRKHINRSEEFFFLRSSNALFETTLSHFRY